MIDKCKIIINKARMVEFAPLNTPLRRRLQTLAAAGWIVIFVCGGFVFSLYLLYIALYTSYWWAALLYLIWLYADRKASQQGGRSIEWVRKWAWWKYYRDFFPLKLERTAELSPEKNYLFACYPHGVLCSGIFGHFGTHSPDFERLFPGITAVLHTLDQNFNQPILRDLILFLGICGSSHKAISHILSRKEGGYASVLVVGGAAEALKSRPGTYNIILKRRKGFIKVAMQTGASIVPVFAFGETDLYDQLNNPEGSKLRNIQEKLRKILGIAPVIFLGRGIFQYSFGIVPHRRPVNVIVGKPIEVPHIICPSYDEVNEIHAKFTTALIELFNANKHRFLKDPNTELVID